MSARNGAKAAMIGGFLLVGLVAVALLVLARASRADALETGADAPSPRDTGLTLPVSILTIAPNPLDGGRMLPFGVAAIAPRTPAAEKRPRAVGAAGNTTARETPHHATPDAAPSTVATQPTSTATTPNAPAGDLFVPVTQTVAPILGSVTNTVSPVLGTIGTGVGGTLGDVLATTARAAPILGVTPARPAAMGADLGRPATGAPVVASRGSAASTPMQFGLLSIGAATHHRDMTMLDHGATPVPAPPTSPALPPVDAPAATGNGGGSRSSGGHPWTPVVFLAFVGLVLGVGRRFAFDVRLLRSQRLALLLERPG